MSDPEILAAHQDLELEDVREAMHYAAAAVRDRDSSLVVAGVSFDHHYYDERGDVLHLSVGEPRPAARGLETRDGHAIHYDETGAVIGLTLLNVRHTLEQDGRLTQTRCHQSASKLTR